MTQLLLSSIGYFSLYLLVPIIFGVVIGLIMFRKEILFGVRIIAVLYCVVTVSASVLGVILTYLNIIRAEFLGFMLVSYQFGTYYTIIPTIFIIGLAIFSFFIVKGLLKTQNWARNAVIILTGLWIIGAVCMILASLGIFGGTRFYDWVGIGIILMLYGSIFALPFNIAIISYLIFNRKVKAAFYIH